MTETKLKYEPASYSCRACKNATDSEIKRLQETLKEINKMIKDAEEAVYIFPVDLDDKYKEHILEVLEEALGEKHD